MIYFFKKVMAIPRRFGIRRQEICAAARTAPKTRGMDGLCDLAF